MTNKDWKAEYEKLRDTYHYLIKKTQSGTTNVPDEFVFICKKCGDEIGIVYEEDK